MSQERCIRQTSLKGFGLEGQMYLLCQSGKRSETALKQLKSNTPKVQFLVL